MGERIAWRQLAEKRLNDLIEMQEIIEQQAAEIAALREMLNRAENYVRAYKCQVNAHDGIEGASKWLKEYLGVQK